MSKTAARFTLADISRATRAAKRNGADAIQVAPDGTITILLKAPPIAPNNEDAFEKWERDH
jgi:hypothetical protein